MINNGLEMSTIHWTKYMWAAPVMFTRKQYRNTLSPESEPIVRSSQSPFKKQTQVVGPRSRSKLQRTQKNLWKQCLLGWDQRAVQRLWSSETSERYFDLKDTKRKMMITVRQDYNPYIYTLLNNSCYFLTQYENKEKELNNLSSVSDDT